MAVELMKFDQAQEEAQRKSLADSIRAKGGTTAQMVWPDGFKKAVEAIDTSRFPPNEIPDYVKAEALTVAEKVKALQTDKTITFIAVSDNHHPGPDGSGDANIINPGNLHMAMAAKIIAHSVPIDFSVSLGDHALGVRRTDKPMILKQLREIGGYLTETYRWFPQFRTIGNHDTGQYRYAETGDISDLTGTDNLQELITDYNQGAVYGSKEFGYCYRDFPEKKYRVIVLNTCELEVTGGQDFDTKMSSTQMQWIADTILDLNAKPDASAWSFMIMGHFPLDYVYMIRVAHILHAYVDGKSVSVGGVTADFTGRNVAKFIANFHGHLHNYRAEKIHDTFNGQPGTPVAFDAWEICTPNSCAKYNNSYGVVNGVDYHDTITYEKTPDSGKDTAFTVNVINPETQIIHSICYGAGYDRTIGYAATAYHSVQYKLTNATMSNSTASVEDGQPYESDIILADKYVIDSATVIMGGVNITSTVLSGKKVRILAVTGDVVITVAASKPASYTNLVSGSIDTDGAIYNGTGYKDGTRDHGGIIEPYKGLTLTGFIPIPKRPPYIIRFGGTASKTYNTYPQNVSVYDSSFNRVSTGIIPAARIATGGVWGDKIDESNPNQAVAWRINPDTNYFQSKDAAYFRVNLNTGDKGSGLIVTIDEPIE